MALHFASPWNRGLRTLRNDLYLSNISLHSPSNGLYSFFKLGVNIAYLIPFGIQRLQTTFFII